MCSAGLLAAATNPVGLAATLIHFVPSRNAQFDVSKRAQHVDSVAPDSPPAQVLYSMLYRMMCLLYLRPSLTRAIQQVRVMTGCCYQARSQQKNPAVQLTNLSIKLPLAVTPKRVGSVPETSNVSPKHWFLKGHLAKARSIVHSVTPVVHSSCFV